MSKPILIQNYFFQVQWCIFYSSIVLYYCFVMFTCLSDCARIFFVQTFMSWYCCLEQSLTNRIKKYSKYSESIVASCFQLINSSEVLTSIHTYSSTVLWTTISYDRANMRRLPCTFTVTLAVWNLESGILWNFFCHSGIWYNHLLPLYLPWSWQLTILKTHQQN